jgi:hypothetical protein
LANRRHSQFKDQIHTISDRPEVADEGEDTHAPTSTFSNTHDHMDILSFRLDPHFQDSFGIPYLMHLNPFHRLLNLEAPGLPSPAMHVGMRGT